MIHAENDINEEESESDSDTEDEVDAIDDHNEDNDSSDIEFGVHKIDSNENQGRHVPV